MNEYELMRIKAFYNALENGIEALPYSQQEELYRKCAVNCVKDTVYVELKRQFDECNKSLDEQYEKYGSGEYFFADIIERGHIYEMGYPRCLCPAVENGLVSTPNHCECSRQSIIFVLTNLLPDKKIDVKKVHTVMDGANECRFRVTVE